MRELKREPQQQSEWLNTMGVSVRISRSIQLGESSGRVHLYSRCHNKEYLLRQAYDKDDFLKCTFSSVNSEKYQHFQKVGVSAFCIMNNHFHILYTYNSGWENLSNHTRTAHGKFGRRFNDRLNRSGKVAESRPKTTFIQDAYHDMMAHFYIEANPIRAGICTFETLRHYKHCSYRFFAFGEVDQYTECLEIPEWYKELGETDYQRQRAYRALFKSYLERTDGFAKLKRLVHKIYFGRARWVDEKTAKLRKPIHPKKPRSD